MQNTMLKSLVYCNENQNAPLPKIKDILQEAPLKTASAVVAKMAVRAFLTHRIQTLLRWLTGRGWSQGVPLPADYGAPRGLLEMHEAAVRLYKKGLLPGRETFPTLSATPPSSPRLRVDSPPFVPPGSPVSRGASPSCMPPGSPCSL